MRPITRTLGAAGVSSWVFLSSYKPNLSVSLAFIPTSGASLTGKIQHIFDDPYIKVPVTITRSTTVASMKKVAHGLTAADYLVVEGGGAPFDGEFSVATVVDADNLTYTVANSGLTTADSRCLAGGARVFDHALMIAMTSRTDGNYQFPPSACRLNLTAYTSGKADLVVTQEG